MQTMDNAVDYIRQHRAMFLRTNFLQVLPLEARWSTVRPRGRNYRRAGLCSHK